MFQVDTKSLLPAMLSTCYVMFSYSFRQGGILFTSGCSLSPKTFQSSLVHKGTLKGVSSIVIRLTILFPCNPVTQGKSVKTSHTLPNGSGRSNDI